MKTPTHKANVSAVALIAMAGAFTAAPAFAEPTREVRVAFTYNTADTAERIYSELARTVRDACDFRGSSSLQILKLEQACAREMLDDGVAKLNRADIAARHNGGFVTAAAETRG